MKPLDARAASLALLDRAARRASRFKADPRRRRPGPDAAPAPVEPPRTPTLSGGAAVSLDA